MRIGFETAKLASAFRGHEPQIGACRTLLIRHCPRLEMPVGPPRRHHRDTDIFNHFVEGVEFCRHASLRPEMCETVLVPRHCRYSPVYLTTRSFPRQ